MRVLRSLRLRVSSLVRRSQREANLNEELQDYIGRQTERHMASGLSPENAHRAALRDAGGIEQVKEKCRDARGTAWLENTLYDIWFGFRTMRKHRTFAITAVLTLSAGIGAATTMFSVLYGVLIDPFPYTDAKRLVLISIFDQKKPGEDMIMMNKLQMTASVRRIISCMYGVSACWFGPILVASTDRQNLNKGAADSDEYLPGICPQ
jgi:hypothetical protein